MHHANDLNKFIAEAGRVLKKGGLLITVRDHVIFNNKDKEWFLENHPLHKYYGGENAFTPNQYKEAMHKAGLKVVEELKYYESIINYFPHSTEKIEGMYETKKRIAISHLKRKLSFLSNMAFLQRMYFKRIKLSKESVYDETKVPGRMHTYISIKK